MNNILDKLLGGDLRSIGKADEVVSEVLKDPVIFGEVFNGIRSHDPLIRMRAADAIEKISKIHPEYLIPYKEEIINKISEIEQQEVRWHVALMFSYLNLSDIEKDIVFNKLVSWIENSKSKIVIVNSLQSLVDIFKNDEKYLIKTTKILETAIEKGSPAVKARAKKLYKFIN
ncbi:MAG: hypothetical protein GX076_10005 [Clostridiales bacterium]|nr:hypothetical protein [Clostridiales bacterium]